MNWQQVPDKQVWWALDETGDITVTDELNPRKEAITVKYSRLQHSLTTAISQYFTDQKKVLDESQAKFVWF